jgi:surface polysaccharide O-acyltransferase-like enzyme
MHPPSKPSLGRRFLRLVSENTLAIFFVHLIVLYVLQHGYLGFTLNGNTINSIIGVPLAAALTMIISLAIIVPLKKVPYLKKLLG